MNIHTSLQQGTPEWLELRAGKLTASHAQEIATAGKGLETYVYKTLADKYAHTSESYTNEHMERGNELEDQARTLFELETGIKVDQVGFIEYNEFVGCSPDGLIGDDAGLEIKCHANTQHFKLMVHGEKAIESKYIWQCQMNMWVTERKKWFYVSYNPNFDKSILMFEIQADETKHKKLELGVEKGIELLTSINNKIKNETCLLQNSQGSEGTD